MDDIVKEDVDKDINETKISKGLNLFAKQNTGSGINFYGVHEYGD
jgi:hypothetical protein